MKDVYNIEVGKFRPEETMLYDGVHKTIEDIARDGMITPAEINGILLQIQLEVLGVFEYE